MKEPKDYIVFPLDLPTYDQAMSFVARLKNHVGLFKIGLELFISEGPRILESIRDEGGAGVFLDLKLHDIPATVRRALLAAGRYGPEFVTIHCDVAEEGLKEVVEGGLGKTKVLAVTVLTSLSPENLSRFGYAEKYAEDLTQLVLLRARLARDMGCHGVVCSGQEVSQIKERLGRDLIAVTPGIRPAWTLVDQDDQKRIVTPKTAVEWGADYLVIGRPIRDAKDPVDAAQRVAEEVASAL